MTLLPRVGLGCLLLGLFLAPLLGGAPAGAAYGADDVLGAIRLLILVGAILTPLAPAPGSSERSLAALPRWPRSSPWRRCSSTRSF